MGIGLILLGLPFYFYSRTKPGGQLLAATAPRLTADR